LAQKGGDVTHAVQADPAPVTARRALTRDRLLSAASSVFAERGIIGASVEEICEAAGFTRGAFYSNFADKDELVLVLIQQSIAGQYAAAEQAIAETTSAPNRLDAEDLVSHALAAFVSAGRSARQSILTEQELLLYAARRPTLREPYLAFVAECDRQLAGLIGGALRFAELEFTLPFDQAIGLLTAAHRQVQMQALFADEPDTRLMHSLLMAITRPAPDPDR
jgi:AcrR family transcriptional regulator